MRAKLRGLPVGSLKKLFHKDRPTCSNLACSPTFSAPRTGFVEDNFSTEGGRGVDGSGSSASDGERWGVMGSDAEQQMKLRLLACHSPPALWPGS